MNSISNVGASCLFSIFCPSYLFISNRRLYCNRQTSSEVSLPISSSLLKSNLFLGAGIVESELHVRLPGGHVLCSLLFPCNKAVVGSG